MTLPALDDPATLDQALRENARVVLEFGAEWCPPCKRMQPFVEDLGAKLQGRVLVATVDADKNDAAKTKYGVMGLPTLLFLQDGRVVDRVTGFQTRDKIAERIGVHFGVQA